MNPNLPPQAMNPQNPPVVSNPSVNMNVPGPVRPRMMAPNSNVRFEGNNYQQFQQQQGSMNANFQQRPRFPQGEPTRFQPNGNFPRPEGPRPDFQRGPGAPPMFGQRVLPPGPPPRFPTPQQPMRPPMNGAPNQNSQQGFIQQQMESQNHRYQTNDPRVLESENYRTNDNIPRNQPPLSRKSSTLELNPLQDITNNKGFQPEIKQEDEPTSEQNSFSESENDVEEEEEKKPKLEIKEKIQKSNSQIKIEEVTSGLVVKNIKFFEENDTAKTPLTPTTPGSIKRKQRSESASSDVVKGEFYEDDYESGVDETPMIHPNLRSIHQPPSKVARIPFLKSKKSKKSKTEEKVQKSRSPWVSVYSGSVKSTSLHSNCKHASNKRQKIEENYCPEEELLAFFHSSKTTKTLKRDGSLKNDQNAAKDKLVNKPTTNGDINTPKKTPSKLPASKKNPTLSSPTKTPLKSPGTPGSKSLPKTPETPTPPTPLIKKVPMNKIQVGAAPSPNLKAVRSKVGSLANTTHKPGGGNIKIESHKIDFSKTQPRIEAKNDQYAPSGGDKKITQVKLQWSAKSKVGSLENATYKPGGGDKKIESVKLDFKEKAKPKVGSKDNVKHVPGGGAVKIENQKLEFKAQSKVGSLDNVKHKPGGGDIKIFDDKTYLKQISGNSSEGRVSGTQSYGDLSIVREVEGRSAPGTPGRKTSVKIKKTTTVHSSGVKNTTEVIVASQTPKKQKKEKNPSKQEVKLTYSKLSPSKQNGRDQSPVRIMKLPARDDAPILKPNLSDKEAFEDISETSKDHKNYENFKQTSGSSDLLDGKLNSKNDSGVTKFLQDEMVAHEKIGEMWKERNNMDVNLGNNSTGISNQRTSIQNPSKLPPEPVAKTTVSQFSNFQSGQTSVRPLQPQSVYQPNLMTQNQQLTPQTRILNSSFQQQDTPYMSPNQTQPFNSQF